MLPFIPHSTAVLTVGTTASSVDAPSSGGHTAGAMCQFALFNDGSQVVWVCATGAAVIGVAGTNTTSFPIPPGTQPILTFPADSVFSAIAAATGSSLCITAGTGE